MQATPTISASQPVGPGRSDAANAVIAQFDPQLTQLTVLGICALMIMGGLLVFFLRLRQRNQKWRLEYNQVIGTVFFFPTLILLAIYLNLSRDAVVGILGAFLGSLFTRGGGNGRPSDNSGPTNLNAPPEPEKQPVGGAPQQTRGPDTKTTAQPDLVEAAADPLGSDQAVRSSGTARTASDHLLRGAMRRGARRPASEAGG